MSEKELELTKEIVTLSSNVIADKEKEREINAKKSLYALVPYGFTKSTKHIKM